MTRQYKEVNALDGSAPAKIETYTYIKATDVNNPDMETGIRSEPSWINDMLNDLRKEREAKRQNVVESQLKQAAIKKSAEIGADDMGMD